MTTIENLQRYLDQLKESHERHPEHGYDIQAREVEAQIAWKKLSLWEKIKAWWWRE